MTCRHWKSKFHCHVNHQTPHHPLQSARSVLRRLEVNFEYLGTGLVGPLGGIEIEVQKLTHSDSGMLALVLMLASVLSLFLVLAFVFASVIALASAFVLVFVEEMTTFDEDENLLYFGVQNHVVHAREYHFRSTPHSQRGSVPAHQNDQYSILKTDQFEMLRLGLAFDFVVDLKRELELVLVLEMVDRLSHTLLSHDL